MKKMRVLKLGTCCVDKAFWAVAKMFDSKNADAIEGED